MNPFDAFSPPFRKGRNSVSAANYAAGRLSRRDRLEEYLKEKKAQQERLKAKSKVTPFR